jgi:CRP/FNR family cyclic AMP-dependent transcriptional regulator
VKGLKQPILCLKEIPLFEGLSTSEFNQICPGVVNKSIEKGEYLFRQGDDDNAVYLVKKGRLKILQISEDGKETIITFIGPGEIVGETNLFQKQQQMFSAMAIEDVRLCGFRQEDLEKVIEMNPQFAVQIICHLSQKLNKVMQQVSEYKGTSVKERLLKLLTHLANEHGVVTDKGVLIRMYVTQQELGNMIGASRVMVAQVIKELRDKGILNHQGKYYLINTDFCMQHVLGDAAK